MRRGISVFDPATSPASIATWPRYSSIWTRW
jgi:hypothetical protein